MTNLFLVKHDLGAEGAVGQAAAVTHEEGDLRGEGGARAHGADHLQHIRRRRGREFV